jgi:hypothetical protein
MGVNYERQMVEKAVTSIDLDGMTLSEAYKHISELIAIYGGESKISFHTEMYEEIDRLHLMQARLETDTEMQRRIHVEECAEERQRERDRREYERLSKVFGNT